MKTVSCIPNVLNRIAAGCLVAMMLGSPSWIMAASHEVLPLTAANIHWHAPAKSLTVTYLGKDDKQTAILDVKKAAVLDTEISIHTDATSLTLVSGKTTRISFTMPPDSANGITRLKFVSGDHPALLFNDKENAAGHDKWLEMLASKEPNLSIELENTSTASVKFDPKALEQGGAAGQAVAAAPDVAPALQKPADGPNRPAAPHELLHAITPSELKASAAAFVTAEKHQCHACFGKGQVTEDVQVGARQQGALIRKKMGTETHTCKVCGGAGYLRAKDEMLRHSAGMFVKAIASVKRDDPGTQDALSASYKMITDVMIGDYKTWIVMTDAGKSILAQPAPAAGTPVISRATVIRVLPRVGGKRQYLVEIAGIDKMVRISDPAIADEINNGTALVGGLIVPGDKSDPVAVLQSGFLVAPPIDHAWWWWYGVRP